MAMFTVYFIIFLISCVDISAQTVEEVEEVDEEYYAEEDLGSYAFPYGDPRICLEVGRKTDFPLERFSSLPGIGWDNLRNEATGQVYAFNYTQCRETEDGRYLIPDAVFTIPIKSSRVETFAEIFESWNSVNSITSKSINVNVGIRSGATSVSGSFSSEHTRMKRKQIQEKTVAARVQLRYLRYKAKLQPGSPLHPAFRTRLLSIVEDLNQNMTQSAFYKSQLLVRDFGTHVLTNVIAGACLAKTDFLSQTYVDSHEGDKRAIAASASASFAETFKMDASYKQTTDVQEDNGYKKNTTFSYVTTHGGPIYRPYNMTVNQWVAEVDSEMVPMDRFGDPLYFVITAEMFPGIPGPLIQLLEKNVEAAVAQYYEMNTVRGCTSRGSPNFSYAANVDDGSCVDPKSNLTFGGIFQNCSVAGRYIDYNPCTNLNQINPLTKTNSCPSGFMPVLLQSGAMPGKHEFVRKCHSCGFLWMARCCHTTPFQATGLYWTYWCAAIVPEPESPGYLFGGIWSSSSTNMVTKAKKCPPEFYPLRMLQEHSICVSDDYELGERFSVPFGGFTSCSIGNPLAISQTNASKTRLENFLHESSGWPKRCPGGFSQHLAAIDNGCEIRYCIKTGALKHHDLPPLKRPPFSSRPDTMRQTTVFTIINSDKSIRKGRMIVPKHVYDKAMQEGRIQEEVSGGVELLSSFIFTVITFMVGLMWTKFNA